MAIKDCPFCGAGGDHVGYAARADDHWLECRQCRARGPTFQSRRFGDYGEHLDPQMGATEAWNRRQVHEETGE